MSLDQIEQLHNEAMSLADEADMLRIRGNKEDALELYGRAFIIEREAAIAAISCGIEDLSANILIKSAACLGFDAGLIRESEQMVGLALSRNLPEEIAEEMRDLLENIHFSRHLKLNGITLSDNEVQIVVAGNGVAHGMAREDDINDRIGTFVQLALRTAERSKGRKFRAKGKPSKDIRDVCTPYLSVSRAASFAVTMRIGEKAENSLESFQSGANALIEDIATNLTLANDGDIKSLKERIKDQSYLENFVNLAKEFAPDGNRVNLVGITFNKDGKEIPVELKTPKVKYREVVSVVSNGDGNNSTSSSSNNTIKEVLIGTLYAADSKSDDVKIQVNGHKITIKVPKGLAEIVRKYFDMEVSALVSHNKANDTYRLISVDIPEEAPSIL